jgi:hypothetical protein
LSTRIEYCSADYLSDALANDLVEDAGDLAALEKVAQLLGLSIIHLIGTEIAIWVVTTGIPDAPRSQKDALHSTKTGATNEKNLLGLLGGVNGLARAPFRKVQDKSPPEVGGGSPPSSQQVLCKGEIAWLGLLPLDPLSSGKHGIVVRWCSTL